jgi:hypothetical protein
VNKRRLKEEKGGRKRAKKRRRQKAARKKGIGEEDCVKDIRKGGNNTARKGA